MVPPEPAAVDETLVDAARSAAAEAGERLAGLVSLAKAAEDDVGRARQVADRAASLGDEADCPLCGQALGEAFQQVQAHRAAELRAAEDRLEQLSPRVAGARRQATTMAARQRAVVEAAEEARRARSDWDAVDRRRGELEAARRAAWEAVLSVAPGRAGSSDGPPSASVLAETVADLRATVRRQRAAAQEAERLRVRLERRPALELSLATNHERVALAHGRIQALREKVRDLGFDPEALKRAAAAHEEAGSAAQAAQARAHQAEIAAAGERAKQEAAATRLADAVEQHARLAELESEARHLARAADLLAEFRNTVVAAVGPRLAVHAAELFAELTDNDYDQLQVDPETYQLQITDAGKVYGLDRFSGSEIDLANLSLRVAISEHVHLQSGGSIGLLVLDEVFGPLDEDRKARMLLALERLRGRFRQILVVTHDASIKEQLPNAIEVVKLPGRRATARPTSG
jgi:exonuclease SbcC